MSKKEIRFAASGGELCASGNMVLTGRPAVYNSLSLDPGGFHEKLAPGCFDASLADRSTIDRCLLWQHDSTTMLGRESNGTLQLSSDNIGLVMRAELPNTTLGKDVYELVKRSDISSMSFGMFVDQDEWADSASGPIRTVKRARIFEVSCVSHPAYPASSVSARTLFPDGVPESVETRCKRIAVPPAVAEVSEETLRWMSARVELAKRY